MKTRTFRHENVLPNGTFSDKPGAVGTKGGIRMSVKGGGCGMRHCGCSPGHWITVSQPRTNEGVVTGETVKFDNKKEMEQYLIDNNLKRV